MKTNVFCSLENRISKYFCREGHEAIGLNNQRSVESQTVCRFLFFFFFFLRFHPYLGILLVVTERVLSVQWCLL